MHYLERRRDKVIQDDIEFNHYIKIQNKIAQRMCDEFNI